MLGVAQTHVNFLRGIDRNNHLLLLSRVSILQIKGFLLFIMRLMRDIHVLPYLLVIDLLVIMRPNIWVFGRNQQSILLTGQILIAAAKRVLLMRERIIIQLTSVHRYHIGQLRAQTSQILGTIKREGLALNVDGYLIIIMLCCLCWKYHSIMIYDWGQMILLLNGEIHRSML